MKFNLMTCTSNRNRSKFLNDSEQIPARPDRIVAAVYVVVPVGLLGMRLREAKGRNGENNLKVGMLKSANA